MEVEFILPGCTSVTQVIDVGPNKPFKDCIHKEVDEFLIETWFGSVKPFQQTIAKWITNVWANILENMIHNLWHHVRFAPPDQHIHLHPVKVEHNDLHDPLALVEGDVSMNKDGDNKIHVACNDDSIEF